jgi:hypothetical protein
MERKGAGRRPLTLAVSASICALLAPAAPAAQAPLDAVLQRVADYTAFFVSQFSNVVANEQYRLEIERQAYRPRYRSDFLLVRYPGEQQIWMTFRDVREIDGRPLRNADDRLLKLFAAPFENAAQRASEIHRETSRYFGALSNPMLVLSFVQRHYQPRFRFSLGGRERELGPRVVELKYSEVVEPTILQQTNYLRPNLHSSGSVWLEEDTGRILKTRLVNGIAPRNTIVETTFKPDEALKINVPVELRESYFVVSGSEAKGVATYGEFRRFQVQTSERLEPAPGAPPTQ